MKLERHHVQFFTAVCNDWLLLLESDEAKDIVVNALHYQVKVGHVKIAAFVIMPPIIFISSGAFKMNAGLKMCSVIFKIHGKRVVAADRDQKRRKRS